MKNVYDTMPMAISRNSVTTSVLGLSVFLLSSAVRAEELTFNEHIQPILSEYCYHCHGPDSGTRYPKDNPLRLDTEEGAFTPRENGKPVIIKGDPQASLLITLIHSKNKDEIMPPPESHKELGKKEIELLEKWIEQGAEYQDHWAFLTVTRPTVSKTESKWALREIDHFVEARLDEEGLKPNEQEKKSRFYRRLHLDLTGLPPSPRDVANFSWDRLDSEVDRLLSTPSSAEHFARYWLDAARYGDTHGIHNDDYRSIWPFRDWVIEAFQKNMRWDQFTIEQIGGDLLPEPTVDQVVATGFNRCLPTTGEGGAIPEEYNAIYAQDRTNTTSAVWLGLTMGCAACHDHKFDPISMVDVYSMNAFFRNTSMNAMDGNKEYHPPMVFVPNSEEDRANFKNLSKEKLQFLAKYGKLFKQQKGIHRKASRAFKKWYGATKPESIKDTDEFNTEKLREILAKPVNERKSSSQGFAKNYFLQLVDPESSEIHQKIVAAKKRKEEFENLGAVSLVMDEKRNSKAYAHILNRGVYSDKGEKVFANTPASLPPMSADSPRNRLGLAQWLVSRENPLTARVTMNRLWYQLFGTGIVETVEDFGIMGARPSHPKLLDWLAAEFMDSGWDHRHMVKTIVTSATYRQSAKITPEKLETDPDNRLLARGPRYRLDAEQIRDLSLAASGLLSKEVGGRSVKPYMPEGVWEAVAMKGSNTRFYKEDSGDDLYRRSIYTFLKRSAPHPTMEIMNATAREVFCVRRERTNTPLQAFVTLNDPQFVEASRHLAERAILAEQETSSRADFISKHLLARPLEPAEHKIILKSLEESLPTLKESPEDAEKLISIGASKPTQDINAPELAAWTLVASKIFNLDEALTK